METMSIVDSNNIQMQIYGKMFCPSILLTVDLTRINRLCTLHYWMETNCTIVLSQNVPNTSSILQQTSIETQLLGDAAQTLEKEKSNQCRM